MNILSRLVLNMIYKLSWQVQSQETYWKMMQFQPFLNPLRALLEKEFLHLREKISKSRNILFKKHYDAMKKQSLKLKKKLAASQKTL